MMTRNSGWKVTHYRPLADSVQAPPWEKDGEPPAPPVNFTQAKRTAPARAASMESDVSVPLAQAIITGLVIGGGVGVGAAFIAHQWWVVPLCIGGAAGIAWILLLVDHRSLLRVVEEIVNEVEEAAQDVKKVVVQAELHTGDEETDHIDLATLPAPSLDYLREFAEAVLNGDMTFSERDAQGCGYSRTQWRELRDAFIMAGWAAWKDPENRNQGVILTRAGKAILAEIVRIEG